MNDKLYNIHLGLHPQPILGGRLSPNALNERDEEKY
jgi:hypothetical protein